MVKKEPVIIKFETAVDQQNFINWAIQPSELSIEVRRAKEIQRKVKKLKCCNQSQFIKSLEINR